MPAAQTAQLDIHSHPQHLPAAAAAGMDIKLRCLGCGHEVMQPRRKVEKMIKRIIPKEELK